MNKKNSVLCAFILLFALITVQLANITRFAEVKIAVAATDETSAKSIYLTFDDGPSDKVTPKILDVLKDEDVRATFFIIGKQAELRKEIIRREFAEGHTVAVHSYSHAYRDIYSSPERLLADIDRCNALIKEITGSYSFVYRFPGGSFGLSRNLISAVSMHGMRYVDWNASTRDAELISPTPAELYKCAVNTPANREHIVLLSHDSTDKSTTAEALKDIIGYYKGKGYAFKTF